MTLLKKTVAIASLAAFSLQALGAQTKIQNWQVVQDTPMEKLGLPTRTDNQTIMSALNKGADVPLRLYAGVPADENLYIGPNKVEGADGAAISSAPADDQVNTFAVAELDFLNRSTSGGTVKTDGGTFSFAACTVGQFRRLVFKYVSASNWVDSHYSPEVASEGSLENVGTTFSVIDGIPLGWVELECTNSSGSYKTIGSSTTKIEAKVGSTSRIYRFGAGASSGAGGDTSFKLQSIASNVGTLKKGSLFLNNGWVLYTGSDISLDLKTEVNTAGITSPANSTVYYLYIDLQALPSQSTGGNTSYPVYIPAKGTSGAFVVLAANPEKVDQARYVPLAVIKTDGSGNYTTLDNLPQRRHQIPTNASVVPNFFKQDSSFEAALSSNYFTYKDTAATTPADGTGGSPTTITLSRTVAAGEPLFGKGGLKVAKSAANGQGEGFSYDLNIDRGWLPGPATLSFLYDTNVTNYVAGDMVVCVYDKDIADYIVISGADVGRCKSLPKAKGLFQFTFNFNSSDDYRISFHYSTTNANAYTVFFDEMNLNPLLKTDGVAQSESIAYTPTFSNSTNIFTNLAQYRRDGDMLELDVKVQTLGGGGAGGTFTVSLPSGLTVDSIKQTASGTSYFGSGVFITNTTVRNPIHVNYSSATTVQFQRMDNSSVAISGTDMSAAGYSIIFQARIPISQWSGSANVVNGPRIEYACNTNSASDANDTTSFSNDPDGCLIPQVAFTADRNRQIRFPTAKQPTDTYRIEYRASNGYWQPLTNDFQSGLTLLQLQAPTYYGFNIDRATTGLPATDLNMTFARYAYANNGTFGGAGASWAAGGLVGYRYRVLKLSGVGADAYAPATATSDGFVSPTTQTFGGAKTFNDVTTFKHSSGATTAGVYNTSNEWTFGTAGGAGGIRLPGPSGGTPALLNTYETLSSSGSFTEFSGTGTSGTAYLKLTRIGNQVTGAIRFVVSGSAGSLNTFGLRDATGVWPSRFHPSSMNSSLKFHVGYCSKESPSGSKFYIGLTQSSGTNYIIMNKDSAFSSSEDTGWCSFSYQMD